MGEGLGLGGNGQRTNLDNRLSNSKNHMHVKYWLIAVLSNASPLSCPRQNLSESSRLFGCASRGSHMDRKGMRTDVVALR